MRPLKKIIDIDALRHNWLHLSVMAGNSQLMAVVKANAYGHDVALVSKALKQSSYFTVACIEEAIELRKLGIMQPILLLEGIFSAEEYQLCAKYQLEAVIHNHHQLQCFENLTEVGFKTWFKVDSGMHRLGFSIKESNALAEKYRNHPSVKGVISHFACADEADLHHAQTQIAQLNQLQLPKNWLKSYANSAAIYSLQSAGSDYVRPGIMLYGISPFMDKTGADLGLRPVMSLQTEIIATHYLLEGETAGYGQGFVAPKAGYLATIAGGYGDGLSRHIPSQQVPVLINGKVYYWVGHVAMDMSLIWLGDIAYDLQTKVTLFGQDLPIEMVAKAANTIPYTLTTMLTPRVHLELQNG